MATTAPSHGQPATSERATRYVTAAIAGDNEDLRGLLNAGHQRGRPTLRYDAGTKTVDHIETFAMAALAGIGAMPDTIEDRAVVIRMRRRAPGEEVQPYRVRRDGPSLADLRNRLNQWVRAHLDELTNAVHLVPALGAHRLISLRPEHLERAYQSLMRKPLKSGKPRKPATVHRAHRTMRAALSEAVRRGYLTNNPATHARAPRIVEEEIERYGVSDIQRLLRIARQRRNSARWAIALALGLRQGQALGLLWSDIDLDEG